MSFKEITVDEVYRRDGNLKKEDVRALKEWLSKQPHLPEATELQLALFLHSTYYSIEAAKTVIDVYFTIKTASPDIFDSRNFDDEVFRAGFDCFLYCPLPSVTSSGDTVILSKLVDPNPSAFSMVSQFKSLDATISLHLHQKGPTNGVQLIVDLDGVSLGHLLKANLIVLKKFSYYLQEAIPIRLKRIHFINTVTFMDKLFALMKSLVDKTTFDMFVVHTEIESLYKYVPKEMLPKEYGGKEESIIQLRENLKNFIRSGEDFLKFQEQQLVDESKREGPSKYDENLFGVDGTFKKLEID